MRIVLLTAAALAMAVPARAQDEGSLRRFFEGRSVIVKIDMPATDEGVNIHPTLATPLDYSELADDVDDDGIGVHRGESAMVTKVHITGHHIEFQLNGGGFGTFADSMALAASSAPVVTYEGKSRREKDLEDQLKWATGAYRWSLQQELNDLRRERTRDNLWAAGVNAQQAGNRAMTEQAMRTQGGSRFNIRYDEGFPPESLTPEGVMDALADYVDFAPMMSADSTPDAGWDGSAEDLPTGTAAIALKKGLTVAQVEQLLGPAVDVSRSSEGSIEVVTREYTYPGDQQHVEAQFVGGVLVDYTITATE